MANFNTHLTGAFVASAILSITCHKAQILTDEQLILTTLVGTAGGLLPDIDSKVSKPVTIGFDMVALMCAFILVIYVRAFLPLLQIFIALVVCFVFIRYCILDTFSRFTKHRGVVHSIPYMLILALLLVYLNYYVFNMNIIDSWMYAAFLFFGSMVHLILDEMYSVDLLNRRIKRSFGTALKIYHHASKKQFLLIYATLAILLYYAPPVDSFWLKISNPNTWLTLQQSLI